MINLCTDPTCDEEAGLTIQRQIDPAPVPFCHPHGRQREHELKQGLENYRIVVFPPSAPPTDLELALVRIAELEETLTKPAGGGNGERLIGGDDSAEQQLETALHTLEMQSKTLERTRSELAESKEAFNVARRESDRLRSELERTRSELAAAKAAAPAPAPTGPITPPPTTRPDPK